MKYLNIDDSFHLKDFEIGIRYSTIETKEAARIGYKLMGFFFRMSTQVKTEVRSTTGRHLSTNAERETRYIQYGKILLFQ